jgi:hypothetical protein
MINSIMNRVADNNGMNARHATQVVARTTMPRSVTPRAPVIIATHMGTGFAGGLLRHSPSKWNDHSRRRLSCIPSRKAGCAAMRDLIIGS